MTRKSISNLLANKTKKLNFGKSFTSKKCSNLVETTKVTVLTWNAIPC